jgi:hypothetical protein
MNAKFLFLTAGVSLFLAAEDRSFGQASGGLGFFKPGINTVQISKLNSSLPAGYPEIANRPIVASGAGYGIFSNFVLGGEGGSMYTGSFTLDNQLVDLSGDFSFFSLGYVVLNNK